MSTLDRLERFWHRLEMEGRYTDANIIGLAIDEISAATVSRDGTVYSPSPTKGDNMNTWFKKLLQALGIIRGDLDALLGHGASFASKLDAHAAQALDDAQYHYDQSAKHDDHGDDAHDEYVRATKVAQNVRALFAV